MKRNPFWLFSLVALLILAVCLHWPVGLRIAVIADSVLILGRTGRTVWEACYGR